MVRRWGRSPLGKRVILKREAERATLPTFRVARKGVSVALAVALAPFMLYVPHAEAKRGLRALALHVARGRAGTQAFTTHWAPALQADGLLARRRRGPPGLVMVTLLGRLCPVA